MSRLRTILAGRRVGAALAGSGALPVQPPVIEQDDEQRYRPIDRALIRRLLRELFPYRVQYALGIFVGLIHVLLEQTGPLFIAHLIDYCTGYIRKTNAVSESQAIHHILFIMLLWTLAILASVTLLRWCIILVTRAGESVQFDIRQKLFRHLQRLSMSYYDKHKLGRIISRMTSDINSMREVNVWGIWKIAYSIALMIFAIGAMILLCDWRLLLSVALLAPALLIVNRLFQKKAGAMHQVAREGWTRVSTNLAENITGMRVVTAFNRQDPNLRVFNHLQDENTMNNVRVARVVGIYQPFLQVLGYIGRAIILLYGGYLVADGQLKVGAVVLAYFYLNQFMDPVIVLGDFYNQLMQAMAGGERVFNLLDTKPDVSDLPDAQPLPRIVGQVKFENVTFGYAPERPILHEISFTAESGQMFALVGSTGSGKTSIVSLIARFYQPQQGRVLIDGQDIRHVTGESLHKQMGLVLQVNYLFTGTVMENIRYARPEASEADVIAASKEIGSYGAIMSLPNGFANEVGERGANMSLGQRQLICFTRAYLADPRIFMLDEATSAVDTATELIVQESLEKLLAGRTTFVVAHRLSTIMRADQILVIDHGRIIERGTHRDLMSAGGRYAHLYQQFILQGE
ncbi:ABC transporter ATP-binding protein [soil metagenome]